MSLYLLLILKVHPISNRGTILINMAQTYLQLEWQIRYRAYLWEAIKLWRVLDS